MGDCQSEVSGTAKSGLYEQEVDMRHELEVEVAQHTEGCSSKSFNKSYSCRSTQRQMKEGAPYQGRSGMLKATPSEAV